MGRSGSPGRHNRPRGSMRAAPRPTWSDTFDSRKRRERLVRGLEPDQVLAAAENARRLGDQALAVGLVRDRLVADLSLHKHDAYAPGDVMRRVLGALGVNADARSLEYRQYLSELMPGDSALLDPESPAIALARRALLPVPFDSGAVEAAEAVVGGMNYEEALAGCLTGLRADVAAARDRELEWLLDRVEIRFSPDLAGIGRLWRAAAERAGCAPAAGARLNRPSTERLLLQLAASRDESEIVAAMAEALEEATSASRR